MTYTTVFDAANEGYSTWWVPAIGFIFIGVGVVLVLAPRVVRILVPSGPIARYRKLVSWMFLAIALVWTLTIFGLTYGEYHKMTTALYDKSYAVVEGVVTKVARDTQDSEESFTIEGRRFSYTDNVLKFDFEKTSLKAGSVKDGMRVRIAYLGPLILRLQVARGSATL
jgi:hypothetical protein